MKIVNKIIMSGIAALLMSCSNEEFTPDVTGATTEPSSVANLTDEQKAILARSLYALVDPSIADSLRELFGSDINKIYNDYVHTLPYSIKNARVYHHPSKDKRKVCDIVTFTKENGIERNGVLRATSYDDDHECAHGFDPYDKCKESANDYFYNHPNETILATKIVDVDGIPVVINTMGSRKMRNSFWGYGVSCVEALNQFKQSCESLNGLFWDFGDGCSQDDLELTCASFIPEGQAWYDVLNSYSAQYENQCMEDSINYAPYDDENYVLVDPYTYQPYLDSLNRAAFAERDWAETLKRSTDAYIWQFSIIDSTISTAFNVSGTSYLTYKEYPELSGYLELGYNTLPDSPVADAYRKEGVYVLPDSLLTTFFPKLAEYPGRLDEFRTYRSSRNSIYYILVLKDVGTKGHVLNGIRMDGFYVTDIVKSGNCPEDTTVHYPMILLADSPDWDILNRPIIKKTYASEKWNCDKPETLQKIEPYGEWIASKIYDYGEYVKLFGND